MTAEVTQLITIEAAEHVAESPFYIPMTGPATRPRCSLSTTTLHVLDAMVYRASAGGRCCSTRYAYPPAGNVLDESTAVARHNLRDDNSALTVDLTNSDVYRNGRWRCRRHAAHRALDFPVARHGLPAFACKIMAPVGDFD